MLNDVMQISHQSISRLNETKQCTRGDSALISNQITPSKFMSDIKANNSIDVMQ